MVSISYGFIPLFDSAFDPNAVSLTLSPAILLLASVVIMLFAQWKPFERYWQRRIRRQDQEHFPPEKSPFRSEVFTYPILQQDRENFYNLALTILSFTFVLSSSLLLFLYFPMWMNPLLAISMGTISGLSIPVLLYTSYRQWVKVRNRLPIARFIYLIRQNRPKRTDSENPVIHEALEEMILREQERNWNRIIDQFKTFLRDTAATLEVEWLEKLKELPDPASSDTILGLFFTLQGFIRERFLDLFDEKFQELWETLEKVEVKLQYPSNSASPTQDAPNADRNNLIALVKPIEGCVKQCRNIIKVLTDDLKD